MFISDKVIFLQLDKTASTYITKLLDTVTPGESRAKHSRLEQGAGGRCVIGSVRNPWDWYVSLWAYGCAGRGKVYRQLTMAFPLAVYRLVKWNALHPGNWGETTRKMVLHCRNDSADWRRLYGRADDPALFREWLRLILSEPGKDILSGRWAYSPLPLRAFTGLLTYRFLRLFVEAEVWDREAGGLRSPAQIEALYRGHRNADRFIRMEHLTEDLVSILQELEIHLDRSDFLPGSKINTSEHNDAAFYYDAETIELVRQQEQLLISEFGYEPPVAAWASGSGIRGAPDAD